MWRKQSKKLISLEIKMDGHEVKSHSPDLCGYRANHYSLVWSTIFLCLISTNNQFVLLFLGS